MGLQQFEIDSVPREYDLNDCYRAIYSFVMDYIPQWKNKIHEVQTNRETSERLLAGAKFNLRLCEQLPAPDQATTKDMDYVAGQVIYGKFEGFYHEQNTNGIKVAAYAHRYFELRCGTMLPDEETRRSMKSSRLYSEFGMHHERLEETL
jgi:hypothetical protein